MALTNIFPTTWQLLLPNWNITTVIGFVLIVLGVLGLYISIKARVYNGISNLLNKVFDLDKVSFIMLMTGIVLVWGISIIQDFLSSVGGQVIVFGTIILIAFGVILFWDNIFGKKDGILGGVFRNK